MIVFHSVHILSYMLACFGSTGFSIHSQMKTLGPRGSITCPVSEVKDVFRYRSQKSTASVLSISTLKQMKERAYVEEQATLFSTLVVDSPFAVGKGSDITQWEASKRPPFPHAQPCRIHPMFTEDPPHVTLFTAAVHVPCKVSPKRGQCRSTDRQSRFRETEGWFPICQC